MLPLQLSLRPSRYLTYLLILLWLSWLGLLITAQVSAWLVGAFAVVSGLLYWRYLRLYAWLLMPRSLQSIRVSLQGWCLYFMDGHCVQVRPIVGCRFWPGFICLRLADSAGVVSTWLLLADSADAEQLRRLRVLGRWGPKLAYEAN